MLVWVAKGKSVCKQGDSDIENKEGVSRSETCVYCGHENILTPVCPCASIGGYFIMNIFNHRENQCIEESWGYLKKNEDANKI